eukprot:SAG31_NODE_30771_length_376_cov_0.931408_1_plen_48_part_10
MYDLSHLGRIRIARPVLNLNFSSDVNTFTGISDRANNVLQNAKIGLAM